MYKFIPNTPWYALQTLMIVASKKLNQGICCFCLHLQLHGHGPLGMAIRCKAHGTDARTGGQGPYSNYSAVSLFRC